MSPRPPAWTSKCDPGSRLLELVDLNLELLERGSRDKHTPMYVSAGVHFNGSGVKVTSTPPTVIVT